MRVRHISYYGRAGGAGGAVTTRRLHEGLMRAGIDSHVLCVEGEDVSYQATAFRLSAFRRKLDSLSRKLSSMLGLGSVNGMFSSGIKDTPLYRTADVIHFQRIYDFLSFLLLPDLTKHKPAVFTLHDTWNYTGHCYASIDCERWKTGCGQCPYLDVIPAIRRDNTRLEWKLKKWAYDHSNLVIVSPSTFQTQQVSESMLGRFPLHQIPYGIDTNIYEPLKQEDCRALLGIPKGKKVVMFIAALLDNFIKGSDLLIEALKQLPGTLKSELVLLLIGNNGEEIAKSLDIETCYLGYVSHDRLKTIAYSAADLFIHPTRADILPLVLMESMSCGTPMVSFDVGGVSDLVRPGITGYLAARGDAKGLGRGIMELLEDEALRKTLSQNCRAIAIKEYPIELQVQRHIELYESLLR